MGSSAYQRHYTSSHIMSSFSRCCSNNVTGNNSFGVGFSDAKGGVGPRTLLLTSQKVDFWIDGVNLVSYCIMYYSSMSHSYKDRSCA